MHIGDISNLSIPGIVRYATSGGHSVKYKSGDHLECCTSGGHLNLVDMQIGTHMVVVQRSAHLVDIRPTFGQNSFMYVCI